MPLEEGYKIVGYLWVASALTVHPPTFSGCPPYQKCAAIIRAQLMASLLSRARRRRNHPQITAIDLGPNWPVDVWDGGTAHAHVEPEYGPAPSRLTLRTGEGHPAVSLQPLSHALHMTEALDSGHRAERDPLRSSRVWMTAGCATTCSVGVRAGVDELHLCPLHAPI